MDAVMILVIICILSIVCSLCLSSIWGYEVWVLNGKRMCVNDPSTGYDSPSMASLMLCPLNQSLTNYLLDYDTEPYYDPEFGKNFNNNYKQVSDLFNTRFVGGTPPPIGGNIVYCNKEYTLCEDKIALTPYVIYIGKNTHVKSVSGVNTLEIKYYFYINTELFINISSKMYDTLETFISDIDKYQKRYPEYETDFLELSVEKEADGVTPLSSDILTDKKNKRMLAALQLFVFPSSNELITTLIKSVILRLSDNVKKDYLELLKKKKTSNTMTTFEYFCYYGMLNLLNNETNILLSR
jgi:hypothetical protein